MRVRLDLGYDGTAFSGWAEQPGLRTVQGELIAGLARVLRLDPAPRLTVAGRTDAGVHANGQVAHVDVPRARWDAVPGRSGTEPAAALVRRLAGVLPPDVRVHRAGLAPEGFDARFSALRRRYAYRVCDDPAGLPPLRRFDVLHHRRPLDLGAMDLAARSLVGLREFAAFCRPREGATTVRTLLAYSWTRDGDGLLVADVQADAFCHSMVRALVGAALAVGDGRRDVAWPRLVQDAAVRDPTVAVVAAQGLTLEEVVYPADGDLAARAHEARAVRTLP
ncbi:tRNA pseudouridine synthase A [Kineococcus sp. R86509]|uniref:tRNA pseudouridine synthase A n=1 Tax=Kineococcus sp. R86509 TaxID=3093851 RepID=UPI0036D3B1A9